jgi:hypothetical protein
LRWISVAQALPEHEVLIYCRGEYRLAVLLAAGDADPVFMDVHSSDLLPWPSHWMELPSPPGA